MERQVLVTKNQTINKDVKICVECGSYSIHKAKQIVFCKECERFFQIKEDRSWVTIHVEVFVDIMMPIRHLEIQTYRFSESIVIHAI